MIFASTNDKPSLAGRFFAGGQNLLTNNVPASLLSTSTIETKPHRNYTLQWNLNVQRQITSDLSVTVGYIGSHGVHMLIRGDDGNMTPHTQTSSGLFFPGGPAANTSVGIIRYVYWGSDSFYHAMNVNVDKRMSHDLQYQFAYTWAKSINDNSSTIAGDTFGNGLNSLFYFAPKSLRGLSDFHVGQNASINVLWALPSPKSANGLVKSAVGGWQVGTIFKINSGIPTTAIIDGDPMGLGNGGADGFGIPNRVAGCDPINHNYIGSPTPVYINASCFTLPTVPKTSPLAAQCTTFSGAPDISSTPNQYCANLLGNAGRNTIIGPKLVNFDFSATKNNPIHRISETFNVQFRAEIFNIFNRSNFNPPLPYAGGLVFNEDGSNADAGDIRNLSTSPRDVQFAIKVIW